MATAADTPLRAATLTVVVIGTAGAKVFRFI